MQESGKWVPDKVIAPQPLLNCETAAAILRQSFWDALIRAFLVQILGSVAIGMLGGLFREMTPSAPPIGLNPEAEPTPPVSHAARSFFAHNHFWIIFAILFTAIVAARFATYLEDPRHRKLAALFLRINRRVSGQWFRLFVFNAFGAWIYTIVVAALQHFSWSQLLWAWLGGTLQPLVRIVPGGGSLGRWYAWYGQNQVRFLFWLLYSAAICDDLGLPNYKTLLRWGGRRLKNYLRARFGLGTTKAQSISRQTL